MDSLDDDDDSHHHYHHYHACYDDHYTFLSKVILLKKRRRREKRDTKIVLTQTAKTILEKASGHNTVNEKSHERGGHKIYSYTRFLLQLLLYSRISSLDILLPVFIQDSLPNNRTSNIPAKKYKESMKENHSTRISGSKETKQPTHRQTVFSLSLSLSLSLCWHL